MQSPVSNYKNTSHANSDGVYTKQEDHNGQENVQKLQELIQKEQAVLLKISTFFPLDIFPNDLVITQNTVHVSFNELFGSGRVDNIPIVDIGEVYVDTGPFFATIYISWKPYNNSQVVLHYLLRNDALKAREVIQGLIIAKKNNIDLSGVDNRDLTHMLAEIGESKTTLAS